MLPRIPFASCLDSWAGTGEIDGYFSAAVGRRTSGLHRTRLASFPPYLLVQMKRWASPWQPGHAGLEHFASLQKRHACCTTRYHTHPPVLHQTRQQSLQEHYGRVGCEEAVNQGVSV